MLRINGLPVVLLVLLAFAGDSFAQTTPATPSAPSAPSPTDRGTAIGTTVKAALDAAFPGTAALVNALVGAAADRVKMNREAREAAKAAATQAAEASKQQAKAASNEKLRALDTLATQLDVVIQFSDASATANEKIIQMISYLSAHKNPTKPEWTANVTRQWNIIRATLKPLDAYEDSAILNKKVKDSYINDLLRQVIKANQTKVVGLSTLIKDDPQIDNLDLIQRELAELQPILSAISRITTFQVQTLASDLHHVANPEEMGIDEEKEQQERLDAIKKLIPAQASKQ